ncbi:unnamed protein product [Colletotrichum noveboracense]|uniref:Uncharacterized protein n=1 Tax=Colletotrichum noveboracense TaxID=2664923 RepID=A0A9W4S3D3_9PEZI|nr:unnamed protein product [Colletotrichum noveboracense]
MDHRNYTIAWVLPSSKYYTTAEAFFNEVYNHFSTPLQITYSIRRVGQHNVVAISKMNNAIFLVSVNAIASIIGPIRVGDVVRIPEYVVIAIKSVWTWKGAIGSSSEAFNNAIIINHIISKHNILCFKTTAISIDSHLLVVITSVSHYTGGSKSPTSAA